VATSTNNYHQTREVFGVLASSYELSSFDILFYPYRLQIWLGILGVVALSALLQLAVDRMLRERLRSRAWMNLELIFVGMPLLETPRSHTARLYCLMLMLYTLIIRTIYQGLLYHLIRTHQLNRWPQTIESLVQKNYTVVLTPIVQEALDEIPSVQHMRFRLLESNSELDPLYFLEANHQLRKHVTASALDIFIHFNRLSAERIHQKGQQGTGAHFEIVPEDIINMQLTMYLAKHSFLIDQMNEEIMWMRSVGLLAFWARWELVESYLRNEHTYQILGIMELYAIFLMVMVGLIVGLIVFILELASLRSVYLRKLFL